MTVQTLTTATGTPFTVAAIDARTLRVEVSSKGIAGTARHGVARMARPVGGATHGLTLDDQKITLAVDAQTAAQIEALLNNARAMDPAAHRRDLIAALDAAVAAEDDAREQGWTTGAFVAVEGPAVQAARAALSAHDATHGAPVVVDTPAVARALRGED